MRKIVLFVVSFMLLSGATYAQKQLNSFNELMEVLNSGGQVRVVMHYAKCQLISDNEIEDNVPDAIGGMSIDVYEYFAEGAVRNKKAFVVFSQTKLIQNPLGKGYVSNYAKVKIQADNEVKITAEYLDPVSLEVKMTENFFTSINDGNNEGGLFLYQTK
ncbi:MAG: VirK family protein [Bacteroidales bacterium]